MHCNYSFFAKVVTITLLMMTHEVWSRGVMNFWLHIISLQTTQLGNIIHSELMQLKAFVKSILYASNSSKQVILGKTYVKTPTL